MSEATTRRRTLSTEKRRLLDALLKRRGGEFNTFPLAPAQQRLWVLERMQPGTPLYNVHTAVRLTGDLVADGLAACLDAVVARHEVLRTSFPEVDGAPVQSVAPRLAVPLPSIDLRGLPAGRRDAVARGEAAAASARPFDLARAPLLRVVLFRLADDEYLLLVVVHHIVADGWSLEILVREMTRLYPVLTAGGASPLPDLPLQYGDYARWQRRREKSEAFARELDYWTRRLAGELPVLRPLPPRPAPDRHGRGTRIPVRLPAPLAEALRSLARERSATLFHLLLAAFATLLYRTTGEVDLPIGVPVANRRERKVADLIGLFVNTVVMRTGLDGSWTFPRLLESVRDQTREDLANQELPFERIVEALRPQRTLGENPLFQVMLAYYERSDVAAPSPGLTLQPVELDDGTSKVDLTLDLKDRAGGLEGVLEIDLDLYDRASGRRLVRQWHRLLEALSQDPRRRLDELPLLGPAERWQVVGEWSVAGFPGTSVGLRESLAAAAARAPDAVAVAAGGEHLTFGELLGRGERLSRRLRRRRAAGETLVGVFLTPSLELTVALWGVVFAGGTYLPLDPATPRRRLAHLLDTAGTPPVLTEAGLSRRLPDGTDTMLVAEAEEAPHPAGPVPPDDPPLGLAYLIFTSGSTGEPRAVGVPRRALAHHAAAACRRFGLNGGDRVLQFASMSFDVAAEELFASWIAGAAVALSPPGQAPTAQDLSRRVERERLSVVNLPGSTWQQWVAEMRRRGETPPPGLRLVVVGSEPVSSRSLAAWRELGGDGVRLVNAYGLTETTITSTTWEASGEPTAATLPVGRPLGGARTYVLGRDGTPAAVGAVGEVSLGGPGVARGYPGRPGATASRFRPDPFAGTPGARAFATGDLGRWQSSGDLALLGRADHQLKVRGFRIEPAEVEAVLELHPGAREVAVGAESGERLVAWVVPASEAAPAAGELTRFLRERLPPHMVPSRYRFLAALPRTAGGKLDRGALAALPDGPRPEEEEEVPTAPLSPFEELVAEAWKEVLAVERVEREDDFFELGGQSLSAVRLAARLSEALGTELPVRRVFEAPTLSALAAVVAACRRDGSGSAAEMPRPVAEPGAGAALLSFAQERLWFLERLHPGSALYALPAALRVRGPLDRAALAQALREIGRRHEVLRSRFPLRDGEPVQEVVPDSPLTLRRVELSALAPSERETVALRLLRRDVRRGFDLAAGPPARTLLVSLDHDDHLFLLTPHHIVFDGWSFGILVRELSALVPPFAAGEPSPLAEPPLQYADFARWQRRWLGAGEMERQLVFWREHLAGLAPLELPTDRPRPATLSVRGGTRRRRLPRTLASRVGAFARSHGATPFMVYLTAFGGLLARWSGQADLPLGTPIAQRRWPELEGLVGLLINLLVVRLDLAGDPGFTTALSAVRERSLDAFAHQDLPFEALVDALQPTRDLSRAPLFQVLFVLQNAPLPDLELPGVQVEPAAAPGGVSRYDLTLSLDEDSESGLTVSAEHSSDLFDATTIERLLAQMETLLEAALETPGAPLSTLPLLSPAATHQVLREWNDAPVSSFAEQPIHRSVEAWARRRPEAPAVSFQGTRLDYRELDRRAAELARRLRRRGVGPESIVAVRMDRSPDLVVALLAVLKAGAAYLPLDPAFPGERIAWILEDAGAAAVVVGPGEGEASTTPPRVEVPSAAEVAPSAPGSPADEVGSDRVSPASTAYVLYTSGSTGRPKGVVVSHGNAERFFRAMDRVLDDRPPVRFVALTSVSFDISLLEIFWTLTRGHEVILQRQEAESLYGAGAEPEVRFERGVGFSLFYFAADSWADPRQRYRLLLEGARFADRHGFEAVWTPERHFHPFGGLYPNPAVTGAALAAVTENVHIRAGSVVLPLHEPIRIAEEWSVLDNLSGGRVGISFASGWHARDFALARPGAYETRRERFAEGIDTVRRLWRGETVRVPDGRGEEVEVEIHPRAVQAELPFWVTAAGSPESFRLAGELGGGLLTHLLSQTTEELAEKIAIYRQAWRRAGHGPGDGHVTLMLHTFVGAEEDVVRETVRGPLREYLRLSTGLIQSLARESGLGPDDLTGETMERFLDRAFERYFEQAGLFGTPASARRRVHELERLGVDEIGCLIDFGIETDTVLSGLESLDALRRACRPQEAGEETVDGSLPGQIRRYGATHLQCTPSMARLLLADQGTREALPELREILLGGEALPHDLVQELAAVTGARIHNVYGPTETTVWSTTGSVAAGSPGPPAIGRPLHGTTARVLDRQLRPAAPGVSGEILLGGAGVARGYLRRPALTAERFLPDPWAAEAGARCYRTGDLGRHRADGTLEFLGRADDQVKVRGHRIELGEVESALAGHAGVREAAVAVRGEGAEAALVAYVVTEARAAALRPRVEGEERRRLLQDRSTFTLPNGMTVAHLGDLHTRVGYREIFERDPYLRHGITVQDGDVVFDVGANIGFFSLFIHQKCRPGAVHAFEPIPPTFDALAANVALYGLDVELHRCGVGAVPGTAEFTFYPHLDGLSGRYADVELDRRLTRAIVLDHLRGEGGEGVDLSESEIDAVLDDQFVVERYDCAVRTLSDVIEERGIDRIDLLKIDVERAELDVLHGIRDEHWQRIRQVTMEVDTEAHLVEITRHLGERGFYVDAEELVTVPGGEGEAVEVYMLYARREALAEDHLAVPAGSGEAVTAAALREDLARRLPSYMVPARVVLLDALPRTPNGKIDRRALPAPETVRADPSTRAPRAEPRTEVERRIAEAWRQHLAVEDLGIHENFFEVGGNSLLLARVHGRLQEAFGREISMIEMFRHPTVSSLGRYLSGGAAGEPAEAAVVEEARGRTERRQVSSERSALRERRKQFRELRGGGLRGD